jgi:ribosomal protein L7/L12
MPELMAQVDRIERQVAKISANLGIPYDYPGNAETPPEVIELAQRGDKKGAVMKFRELTGAGLQEAREAVDAI